MHVTSQPLIYVITPTVLTSLHPLFVWNRTRHMNGIFALYKTSHPHFMTSNHHLYDIKPTISDFISPVSVLSHPLFSWYHTNCIYEISSTIHHDLISIVYNMTATGSVSSHPFFQYHNLCMDDSTRTICITSYTLHKLSYPHFMTSHHIIYDITWTVFMKSFSLYLTLHPMYLCHHNCSVDDLRTTVSVKSHSLYVWYLMHST